MARSFCILPQGFSEACAADCERKHRHANLREVTRREASGEIEFFDLHPVTKRARYIERIHGTQRTHIPATMIKKAAGIYKVHPKEVTCAKEMISAFGNEMRAFHRLGSIVLSRTVWRSNGIESGFESDGESAPKGEPVRVVFRPRTPEAVEIVGEYRSRSRWTNLLFTQMSSGSFEIVKETNAPAVRISKAMVGSALRKEREGLNRLDKSWKLIVDHFEAGPFSEDLTSSIASELPSTLLFKTLQAYLS